jgi:hypothetical protein
MQERFGEPVTQLDLGFGATFNAMYLAKAGQTIRKDGRSWAFSCRAFGARGGVIHHTEPEHRHFFAWLGGVIADK